MRSTRLSACLCFGFGLLALAGCAQQRAVETSWQDAQVPPLAPGVARVWVLRMPPQNGMITGADPMVFVNGAPLAQAPVYTVYYHDFQSGTYRFTVQAYGTPANLVDTVQLSPGWNPMSRSRRCPIGRWARPSAAPVSLC